MTDLPSRHPDPDEWMTRRACAGVDPDIFFPVGPQGPRSAEVEAAIYAPAKAICAGCEVRIDCLDYAIANREHHGVWGGLNEAERRKVINHRRRVEKRAAEQRPA